MNGFDGDVADLELLGFEPTEDILPKPGFFLYP
jgi:hypothetical protein